MVKLDEKTRLGHVKDVALLGSCQPENGQRYVHVAKLGFGFNRDCTSRLKKRR
jgi:hypothetical protein